MSEKYNEQKFAEYERITDIKRMIFLKENFMDRTTDSEHDGEGGQPK